jgi:hypothetical protein
MKIALLEANISGFCCDVSGLSIKITVKNAKGEH